MRQVMRSLMFVPGHNEKLLWKAGKTAADVILIDLEDSVKKQNKAKARNLIKLMFEKGAFNGKKLFIRINDRESGELLKDLTGLCITGIDGFVYPKSKTGKDIYFICKLLETIEYEKGTPVGAFKVIPLIETTSAVVHAFEIASASPRVVAIAYGCEDYLADLQGVYGSNNESLFYPRSMIANAARAAGVIPIDTVHINVHNLEDLEKNLILARSLGFEGMLVLSPKELELVHRYFTPLPEEVEKAERIVKIADSVYDEDNGVYIQDNEFIGPPLILQARKILERHKAIIELQSSSY